MIDCRLICFGNVAGLAGLNFAPCDFHRVDGPALVFEYGDFPIAVNQGFPLHAFHFVSQNRAYRYTDGEPFIFLLGADLTAVYHLLNLLQVLFHSLKVFFEFLFDGRYYPLVAFIDLIDFR